METLKLIKNDPWPEPFADAINGRHQHALNKEAELDPQRQEHPGRLCHRASLLRSAPHDRRMDLPRMGPTRHANLPGGHLQRLEGNEEVQPEAQSRRKLGNQAPRRCPAPRRPLQADDSLGRRQGERIPAWANRVVQDEQTKIFSAQVWAPEKPYKFKKRTFKPHTGPLLIYECHIGMAQQEEKVGSYREFQEKSTAAHCPRRL